MVRPGLRRGAWQDDTAGPKLQWPRHGVADAPHQGLDATVAVEREQRPGLAKRMTLAGSLVVRGLRLRPAWVDALDLPCLCLSGAQQRICCASLFQLCAAW